MSEAVKNKNKRQIVSTFELFTFKENQRFHQRLHHKPQVTVCSDSLHVTKMYFNQIHHEHLSCEIFKSEMLNLASLTNILKTLSLVKNGQGFGLCSISQARGLEATFSLRYNYSS